MLLERTSLSLTHSAEAVCISTLTVWNSLSGNNGKQAEEVEIGIVSVAFQEQLM